MFFLLCFVLFFLCWEILLDAKAGGAASTATAVVRKKMAADEAYKILNIEKVPGGVSSKVINEVIHLCALPSSHDSSLLLIAAL